LGPTLRIGLQALEGLGFEPCGPEAPEGGIQAYPWPAELHYDWSDPNRVVLTTIDSNVWGGSSGHTYTFTRQPNGTTDVDAVVVREGKNIKRRLVAIVLAMFGKRVLGKELGQTVKAIEARNDAARAADLP
jgi:hypothetical protein